MKLLIQRCRKASVTVNQQIIGSINFGMTVFVCFEKGDQEKVIDEAIYRITNLRIFNNEAGKISLNYKDAGASILSISQFSLSWDGKNGHRPSFDKSMPPTTARTFYQIFNQKLGELIGIERIQFGEFGADMTVNVENDGPLSFFLSL